MDKYEYKLKLDEIESLAAAKNYAAAAQIADGINWRKVRNVNSLMLVGEIYQQNGRYEDSKELLLMAYDRSPIGKKIIYRLAEIAIEAKQLDEAQEYYDEFVEIAPHDTLKYILKYRMSRAKGEPFTAQIAILNDLKEQEYTEEWAFELAYLYHEAGMADKCIEACDELILWFGDGPYVEKALELKMLYQPLGAEQEEKYRLLREKHDGIVEVHPDEYFESGEIINNTMKIPQVQVNAGRYSTQNLQEELARGIQQIMQDSQPETSEATMDTVKKMMEEFPYVQPMVEQQYTQQMQQGSGAPGAYGQELYEQPMEYAPESYESEAYEQPMEYAPEGYESEAYEQPMEYAPEGYAPEAYGQPMEYAPEGYESEAYEQPMEYAPEGYEPEAYEQPMEYAPEGYEPEAYGQPMEYAPEGYESEAYEQPMEYAPEDYEPEPEAPTGIEHILDDWAETKRSAALEEPPVFVPEPQQAELTPEQAQQQRLENARAQALQEAGNLMEQLAAVMPQLGAGAMKKELVAQGSDGQSPEAMERASRALADANARLQAEIDRLRASMQEAAGPPGRDAAPEAIPEPFYEPEPETYEPELEYEPAYEPPYEPEAVYEPEYEQSYEMEAAYEPEYEQPYEPEAAYEPEYEQSYEPEEAYEPAYEQPYEPEEAYEPAYEQPYEPEEAYTPEFDTAYEPEAAEFSAQQPDRTADEALAAELAAEGLELYEDEPEVPEPAPQPQRPRISRELKHPGMRSATKEFPSMSNIFSANAFHGITDYQPKEPETFEEEPLESEEHFDRMLSDWEAMKDPTTPLPEINMELFNNPPEPTQYAPAPEPEQALPSVCEIKKFDAQMAAQFSYFSKVDGMEPQICQALTACGAYLEGVETGTFGNLVIEGASGCGKTMLATNFIKTLQQLTGKPSNQIGKINGDALNHKNISELMERISGGCLMIERVGELSRETEGKLAQYIEQHPGEILVILEDNKEQITKALSRHENFARKFQQRISIPYFTNDELVEFARTYALENGYGFDTLAVLALYRRISSIQKLDQATTLVEVKELVDEAIDHAEKGSLKKMFGFLGTKRYDENNHVILREKDFEETS